MAGFKRGGKAGYNQSYTHRWINSPNKGRQVCTACGMLKETIWNNKLQTSDCVYTPKGGEKSLVYLPCTVKDYKPT